MNQLEQEQNFWDWLVGQDSLRIYNDRMVVPYPANFTPIEVEQVSESTPIEVMILTYEKPSNYER